MLNLDRFFTILISFSPSSLIRLTPLRLVLTTSRMQTQISSKGLAQTSTAANLLAADTPLAREVARGEPGQECITLNQN
jgi:hypothetical protein